MSTDAETTSRFLSRVLRHAPDSIGLQLDAQGWAGVEDLLRQARPHVRLDRALLDELVRSSDKQRFALSDDGLRIRANQGHSVAVDLGLPAVVPPAQLYHGTATRFLASIGQKGLQPGARHHVHLSADRDTAQAVGQRHGKVHILVVEAGRMHAAGHVFHCTQNGVWLTAAVPVEFLQ